MDLLDFNMEVFYFNPVKNYELEKLENSHPDFQQDLGGDLQKRKKTVLRYIVLNYDMNTPLRRKFPDYFYRKKEALRIAGFKIDPKTKRFSRSVENMMISKDSVVNAMIARYVMYFYNQDYIRLVTFYEWLGHLSGKKMDKNDVNNTDIKAMNDLSDSVEQLTNKIFGTAGVDEESKELKQRLYKAMEEKKRSLRPDDVVKQLQDDKNMFNDMGGWMDKEELE